MRHPRLPPIVLFAARLLAACLATVPAHSAPEAPAAPRNLPKYVVGACAGCHGTSLEGGSAPSLVDATWKFGGSDDQIAASIRVGNPQAGMPAFGGSLSEKDIRGLVVHLRELASKASQRTNPAPRLNEKALNSSRLHSFLIETSTSNLVEPWSLAFLPDGRSLVTEKGGTLRVIVAGVAGAPVVGTPPVDASGQGGLFDVVPHPEFARNGWIYLIFADPQKKSDGKVQSMTAVVRGRIQGNTWNEQEVVFRAPLSTYRGSGGVHFGGRMAFDRAGFLFFSIGERGQGPDAQNLSLPNGKIHRVHDDGRIPADNPFVAQAGAMPSIWSYGHRNPQGLRIDPATDLLWEHEHGPRGGDELNRIQRGRNYGWPLATYGINYNGTSITDLTARADLESPLTAWVPSIAPCGLSVYSGDRFPLWKTHLFVSALGSKELRRIQIKEGQVVDQEIILKAPGRLRDVTTSPDGLIYLLLPDRVARLVPGGP